MTWVGYDESHNSWLTLDDLSSALEKVIDYEKRVARERKIKEQKRKQDAEENENDEPTKYVGSECIECGETFKNRTHHALHMHRKHHVHYLTGCLM